MNLGFALSLVREWELAGVTDAVIAPGSRSGPMAVALGGSDKIAVHVVLDERSAGFQALGISKVTGRPTLVLTTSGTAAANLRPSVTEAFHSGVPMILITADRPLEAHKFGAAQTMEQEELFSDVVLFRASPSVPDAVNKSRWRALASRAFHEAASNPSRRGPVHLNLAFREPLIEEDAEVQGERIPGQPWYRLHGDGSPELFGAIAREPRVLVIAGEMDRVASRQAEATCSNLGWPVFAGPTSGIRSTSGCSVGSFEAFLRSEIIQDQIHPGVIILLGGDLASRVVNGFISRSAKRGARVIRVVPNWNWLDSQNAVTDFYFGSWGSFFPSLHRDNSSREYANLLSRLDLASREGIVDGLGEEISDPLVASELFEHADVSDMLFSSSSMPIRDLEWFAPLTSRQPVVYSNRGVNGIDGVISSFHGAAKAHHRENPGGRSFLLIGDLAFRHDIGALADIAASGLDMLICVTDNSGGAIFSFVARSASLGREQFEQLFAAAQPGDLEAIGAGFGLYTRLIDSVGSLRRELAEFTSVGGVRLLIFRSDREENAALHKRVLERGQRNAEALIASMKF